MSPTTVALGVLVVGVVTSLAMILWFFWCVYDRGGPKHVQDVAKALREVYDPTWPSRLLDFVSVQKGSAIRSTSESGQNNGSTYDDLQS
jgi:hypothetical protein